ncbi:MAG: DUF3943 domain-containing protein [Gammaproteobacteria bacterium]
MNRNSFITQSRTDWPPLQTGNPLSPDWKAGVAMVCFAVLCNLALFSSAFADSPPSLLQGVNYWPIHQYAALDDNDTTSPAQQTASPVGLPSNYFDQQLYYAENPVTEPDRKGLIRDAKYFFFYQFAIIGILYVAPEDFSGWSEEQKDQNRLDAWKENVVNPQFDSDLNSINYIGHPYFGAAYYVRAIERGYDPQTALLYAFALSSIYEFGIEALFEEVSIQDMFSTPIGGALIGYYFMTNRNRIKQQGLERGYFTRYEKFILGITDPLGWLNSKTESFFRDDVDVALVPTIQTRTLSYQNNGGARYTSHSTSTTYGVQLIVNW